MAYPLDPEGLTRDTSAPAEPSADDQAVSGLEVDVAGVEDAPVLSNESIEALDAVASRIADDRRQTPG